MYQIRRLIIVIGLMMIVNLIGINSTFAEVAIPNTLFADKPLVGICIFASSSMLGDKENEAFLNVENTVKSKFPKEKFIISRITATDFKNYLGKKEILVGNMRDLTNGIKLPILVDFGVQNNLDYVAVVICDASTEQVKEYKSGMFYNAFTGRYQAYGNDQISVNKVSIESRVAIADVQHNEYVYNILINKTRNENFRTDTRAIRSIVQEWVKDFNSEINTTALGAEQFKN